MNPVRLMPHANTSLLSVLGRSILDPGEAEDVVAFTEAQPPEEWIAAGISGSDGRGLLDLKVRSVQQLHLGEPLEWLRNRIMRAVAELNQQAYQFELWGTAADDPAAILRYESNAQDHYRPHRDYGASIPTRKLTFTLQLSDPESYTGGDLVFPDENLRATRARGDIVVFPSFLRHTVTPVVRGTRHAAVGWIHGPTFR